MNGAPIVVDQVYDASLSVVWNAITEPDRMRRWFFEQVQEFRPETGFETEFVVNAEGRDFPHLWKIVEVIPEKRIVYNWRYGGYDGDSTVEWDLSEAPGGTQLTLTHSVQETFPKDEPIFSRESCEAGWDYFIRQSLKEYLENADR